MHIYIPYPWLKFFSWHLGFPSDEKIWLRVVSLLHLYLAPPRSPQSKEDTDLVEILDLWEFFWAFLFCSGHTNDASEIPRPTTVWMVLKPCKSWDILYINWWFQPSTVRLKVETWDSVVFVVRFCMYTVWTPGNESISHPGKRKIIFKHALAGDMLVPRSVYT